MGWFTLGYNVAMCNSLATCHVSYITKKLLLDIYFLPISIATINMFAKDSAITPNMLPTKLMKIKSVLPNLHYLHSNSGISQNVPWSTLSFLRWQTSATIKILLKVPWSQLSKKDTLSSFHTSSDGPFQWRFLFMGQILWPQFSKEVTFVHFTHFLVDMLLGGAGQKPWYFFPLSKNKYTTLPT